MVVHSPVGATAVPISPTAELPVDFAARAAALPSMFAAPAAAVLATMVARAAVAPETTKPAPTSASRHESPIGAAGGPPVFNATGEHRQSGDVVHNQPRGERS